MSDSETALARLVQAMRNAQREYFRTRSNTAIAEARRLEKQVDDAVRDQLEQPRLF